MNGVVIWRSRNDMDEWRNDVEERLDRMNKIIKYCKYIS